MGSIEQFRFSLCSVSVILKGVVIPSYTSDIHDLQAGNAKNRMALEIMLGRFRDRVS